MKGRAITVNLQGPWNINDGQMSAPVVMLTPGVRCGSSGCLYYSANELQKCANAWNGIPVTLNHPIEDGIPVSASRRPEQVVGFLTGARFENNKLMAKVNIMSEKQMQLSPQLQQIREVSTGLFSEETIQLGAHDGEKYDACAINIRPDHLALLTEERGACSWEDGCGIRNNSGDEDGPLLAPTMYIVNDNNPVANADEDGPLQAPTLNIGNGSKAVANVEHEGPLLAPTIDIRR